MADFDPAKYAAEDDSEGFDPAAYAAELEPMTPAEAKAAQQALDSSQITKVAKTVGGVAVKTAAFGGGLVDRVAGAPVRSAVGAGLAGQSPLSAYVEQFGGDPAKAPTGKDLAAQMGLSTEATLDAPLIFNPFDPAQKKVSPAGVAGFGLDIATDPTTYIGPGAFIKGGAKGLGKAGMAGVKMAAKGTDIVTGTKAATKLLEGTEGAVKGVGLAAHEMFNPKVAADFPELAKIGESAGISPKDLPKSVEFGPDSSVSWAERGLYERPAGEAQRVKFHAVQQKVRDAFDQKVTQIGGGVVPTRVEAGNMLRKSYDDAITAHMSNQANSYKAVAGDLANVPIDDKVRGPIEQVLQKYRDKAGSMIEFKTNPETGMIEKVPNAEGANLLLQLEGVAANTNTLGNLGDALKIVGAEAYRTRTLAMPPADVATLRQLYRDLSNGFVDTVKEINPERGAKLVEHNKRMHDVLKKRELVEDIIKNVDKDPDQVFKALMEGNTNRLQAVKELLPPEEFQALKATLVDGMRRETASGDWTFGRLHQQMRDKRKFLEVALEPGELKTLDEFSRLGNRLGEPRLSTSGTGASIANQNIFKRGLEELKAGVANQTFVDSAAARGRLNAAKEGMVVPNSHIPAPPSPSGALPFAGKARSAANEVLGTTGKYTRQQAATRLSNIQTDENKSRQAQIKGPGEKLRATLQQNPAAFGEFSTALQSAAARGGDSLEVTHYLLMNTNPAYRERFKTLGQ